MLTFSFDLFCIDVWDYTKVKYVRAEYLKLLDTISKSKFSQSLEMLKSFQKNVKIERF